MKRKINQNFKKGALQKKKVALCGLMILMT